ncbi:NADH-quinone oxidoreductase subunit C [Sporomusaceae bacterium FL31]|nr:NADH-quinone oxidoreductase subunit C [Sporomusaceae bacterium FL31]GCE33641.1 NADH-quinone oxidoreductase subunit C [Sporomusaceae bacterium]
MSESLHNNPLAETIQALYPEDIKIIGEDTQQCLLVERERLLDLVQVLKHDECYQFNMLRNLTAVDYPDYLEIVYHLYSLPLRQAVLLKTRCLAENAEVPSVTAIWPSANFQEREIYDLLGVVFNGHPDLRRILLPDDFTGHPLRKSYTTGGRRN